jgi:crotonobetainyl-CoA:carnitine CoA-transferase CaiB-like acyl-CoA transferase
VRTGRGDVVDVSLLRAGMYCNGSDLSVQQAFGRRSATKPRERHESPLYNSYRTADGRWLWLFALEGDRHWPTLADAIGGPGLAADDRFGTARERRTNAVELIASLDALFAGRTLAEWTVRLEAADVWWAPVLDLAEVVDDPQAEAAGGWVHVPGRPLADEPSADSDPSPASRSVASPVAFWGTDVSPRRGAPALGEHTDDVLAASTTAVLVPAAAPSH